MNTKLLGGVLLVIGTCMAGGMLALPVVASPAGFFYSIVQLMGCWFMMTFSAFLILEVNLWLPTNSNMISMAKTTLGRAGELTAWVVYLCLFYSLIAAYIDGGTDILANLLHLCGIHLPLGVASILFVVLFGFIVCKGIQSVDYANRALMITKLAAYVCLTVWIAPHIKPSYLHDGQWRFLPHSLMVMMTSFGFANLIPSLRVYFNADIKKLRQVILLGSLIPLIAYIIWLAAILGTLPREGNCGLFAMMTSGHAVAQLSQSLSITLENSSITLFARLFASVAVLTSFLGVSLALSDFLADGFGVAKKGKGGVLVYAVTFLPSLTIVLFYSNAFIIGLSYAGVFCVILLMLLPMLMAWYGRYYKKLSTPTHYRVMGGKISLLFGILIAVGLMVFALVNDFR